MYRILEYLVVIGGSVGLFFFAKSTNLPVRQFTPYLCGLILWSIGMLCILYFIRKMEDKHR